MKRKRVERLKAASLVLAGGCLLSSGCLPNNFGQNLSSSTATRLANLFVDILVIEPIRDAADDMRSPA